MRSFRLAILIAAGALAAITAGAQRADAAQAVTLPDRKEVEDALPEGGSMTGRAIFDRFLENRLHSAVQYQTVISRDPGGNAQTSRFWVRWKDYRDKDKKAVDGVYAKTLVKFDAPDDMRATGFLMVVNDDRPNDQFVWSPVDRAGAPRGPARRRRHGHRLHLRRHRLEEHRGRRLRASARRGDRRRPGVRGRGDAEADREVELQDDAHLDREGALRAAPRGLPRLERRSTPARCARPRRACTTSTAPGSPRSRRCRT